MATFPTDVVILAAGNGLRLSSLSPLPKPLVTIQGRPLLDRVLEALVAAHLRAVTIVVGHAAQRIREHPFQSSGSLDITWISNPRYSEPNGMSLLCAEGRVRAPFLLLMADHLFQVRTLRHFLRQPCPPDGALLAVDRKLNGIYDLDDATKVITRGATLTGIGKTLATYDAVDTGMFLCSDAIFDAMKESAALGAESLSDGVRALSRRGTVRTWDIGGGAWIDVDTPSARDEAERMVCAGTFGANARARLTSDSRPTPLPGAEPRRPAVSSGARRTDRARLVPLVPSDDVELVPGRG